MLSAILLSLVTIFIYSVSFPQIALAATRLGLHVTEEELTIWQQRAASGPYKAAGDVSTNSPGDWNRIVANRNTFAANPSNGRWSAPVTSAGCVDDSTSTYGWPEAVSEGGNGGIPWALLLRDAAFYGLVMNVTTDDAAIKAELLWLSSQTFADWGDPAGIWCFAKLFDIAPSFGITSVLTRLLFAYDYLGRAAFTQPELDQLDRWFFDAADFWRRDSDQSLGELFVNRLAGNYTLASACSGPVIPYVGGPTIYHPALFYNNRRGAIIRFTALAGVYLTQAGRAYTDGRLGTLAQVVASGKLFVQEFVRFGVFPEGFIGDYERRTTALPDLGYAYSGATLGEVAEIADVFARTGDLSLYQYNTALGGCGTTGVINDGGSRNGQPRDLLFSIQAQMKYITDGYARYYPDSSTQENRIDGRDPRNGSGWHSARDANTAMVNIYFQDTFIKQAYTRTHVNSIPYPVSPEDGPMPWQGENAIFPGILFMFGQMEGVVSPYTLELMCTIE